ncbi:MAG: carboxylating nicotinate-nucleotide diphosphorylase, partial [Promethearchaeota archaeon]
KNMSFNRLIIEKKIREFIEEDCNFIDVSSNFIPDNSTVSAKIITKSNGFISGLEELAILFEILKVDINFKKKDGESIEKGDIVLELKGNTKNILIGERVGLNLATHMSAITTTTREYVNLVKASGKNVKIAATRKTTPGLRIFEKKAVLMGGGETHRFSLDDMIILKDTHLKYYNGDVKKLLVEVKTKASFSKKIEIEIENVDDVLIAAKNGADIIMLDNMSPDQVEDAITILRNHKLRDNVIIEVSGGINKETIVDYIIAEPDIISIGNLTQFPSTQVDLSLRFD